MNPVVRFALESHPGPYEKWPLGSRLIVDGELTRIRIPGYVLLHQFETPHGFVLVTDDDCPYEERTSFTFLSKNLRVLSCRWLGWMYATFILDRIEWIDDRRFVAVINVTERWQFTIRDWGIWYLRPRLKMQRLPPLELRRTQGAQWRIERNDEADQPT